MANLQATRLTGSCDRPRFVGKQIVIVVELRDDAEYYSSLRGRIVSTAVGR
jgi:hypothetical protein